MRLNWSHEDLFLHLVSQKRNWLAREVVSYAASHFIYSFGLFTFRKVVQIIFCLLFGKPSLKTKLERSIVINYYYRTGNKNFREV